MHLSKVLTLSAIFLFSIDSHAQITIGNNESPIQGSLLQLKETPNVSNGAANSTKGMTLPRVALVDIGKLQPMYSYADTDNTPDADDLKIHEGLLVYNVEDLCKINSTQSLI